MLANVLHVARRILSRSPSVQSLRSQEEINPRNEEDADMVSTRSGAVAEGTPRSEPRTRRGKRTLEVQGTPTPTKRRRKSEKAESETPEADQEEEVTLKDDNIVVTPKTL